MTLSLVIASQLGEPFNSRLSEKTSATVIAAPEAQPWTAAKYADILLIWASPAWSQEDALGPPADWPSRLKWVYAASAGVDFYPSWLLDVPNVTCGRGIAADQVADYVMAAIYLQVKDLESVRVHGPSAWRSHPLGQMAGSTVGIVGLGETGTAVARRALATGARVTAVRRRRLPSAVAGVELLESVEEVIASAEHLVLAMPRTPATNHMIDASVLSHARPNAHLINVGRGSVLDQDALVAALDSGRLGFATLDVTEPEPLPEGHPLWTHPRVRLTPHVSANHAAFFDTLLDKVTANVARYMRGDVLLDVVDKAAGY